MFNIEYYVKLSIFGHFLDGGGFDTLI